MPENLESLLVTEDQQLQKLNDIVIQAIEEEKLISKKLYDFEDSHLSFKNKLADKVASFGGSWSFILFFLVLMMAWMASNLYLLRRPFDPFPFILLNLVLS